jgi:hypothetical protein
MNLNYKLNKVQIAPVILTETPSGIVISDNVEGKISMVIEHQVPTISLMYTFKQSKTVDLIITRTEVAQKIYCKIFMFQISAANAKQIKRKYNRYPHYHYLFMGNSGNIEANSMITIDTITQENRLFRPFIYPDIVASNTILFTTVSDNKVNYDYFNAPYAAFAYVARAVALFLEPTMQKRLDFVFK